MFELQAVVFWGKICLAQQNGKAGQFSSIASLLTQTLNSFTTRLCHHGMSDHKQNPAKSTHKSEFIQMF